jgi:tetratricopeptide (TPR) repeat protein
MTADKPAITGTQHELPFEKLSPGDFERLCLDLLQHEGFTDAEHLGAAGSEQGRDIVAWRDGKLWAFQCKRVRSFGSANALKEIKKVLALPEAERPAVYEFLVTCDVSAKTRKTARDHCAGVMECRFSAVTELDARVNRYPDLVKRFFQLLQMARFLELLPERAKHFTDREKELEQLPSDLQPGEVLTLCGPGGIGKTALAAEVIWRLDDADELSKRFPDGVIFHTFYNQPQAALALEAIARAYGEEPRPSPAAAAQRVLSGRVALLVLDGAENADDLQAVLSVAGRCGVLVTSRPHPLVSSEWTDVRPLEDTEAAELLQAWGGDCASDEVAVARICELVGRLPLALRLAGHYLARCQQDAGDYLTWLEKSRLAALDFGKRQHESVPVLMERSIGQVSQAARAALGVAGVLALASFDRTAVATALEVSVPAAGRALGELVDYGLLLRNEEGRYQASHALVHTYAREGLAPPVEVIERLAAHYAAFAREQSQLGREGYARLDAERPHLIGVLEWGAEQEAWDAMWGLAWAIGDQEGYLDMQGHWAERVSALQAGLVAARALEDRDIEGAFLYNLGNAYSDLGQADQAIEFYEQSLVIAREVGDRQGEGIGLGELGNVYGGLGHWERAVEYYNRALAIAREICAASTQGSQKWTAARRSEGDQLGNIGLAYRALGQVARAIEYHEQALAIYRMFGDQRGEAHQLSNLGNAYHKLEQVERAIKYHQQALAIAREIGDRRGEGADLGNLGNAYHDLGQLERAAEYHELALAIHCEIGDRRGEGLDLGNLGHAYHHLGQVKRAIGYYERALDIAREIGGRHSEGTWLDHLGLAYRDLGQLEQARDYIKQALAIFEEIKSPDAEQARRDLDSLKTGDDAPGLEE